MERTAEIFLDHGRQAVLLPDDIRLSGDQVMARQDEQTGDVILSQMKHSKGGDFEKLFSLLDELGPAPANFMLNVCDPLLEDEDIFEAEGSG